MWKRWVGIKCLWTGISNTNLCLFSDVVQYKNAIVANMGDCSCGSYSRNFLNPYIRKLSIGLSYLFIFLVSWTVGEWLWEISIPLPVSQKWGYLRIYINVFLFFLAFFSISNVINFFALFQVFFYQFNIGHIDNLARHTPCLMQDKLMLSKEPCIS